MNKPVFAYIFSFLLLLGCGTTNHILGGHIKKTTASELNSKTIERRVLFTTFSGKAKIDVTGKDISQTVNASIDIKKDSVIGISLRLLGVEGARIQITPDSIIILDRLNQEYIPRDFSFIEKTFALKIDFYDLQNLIMGSPVFYDSTALTLGASDDKYVLITQKDVYKNTLWMNGDFDIMRMFIEDLIHQRTLTLGFDDYNKIQGQQFAFIRTILIDAQDDLSANIEFSRVTFDEPFEFTFSINPKYKRVD